LYRGMQSYYRNVALWLATPEQRASMLFTAAWGVAVGKQPGAFHKVMGIWEIGARVVDVIGRTAPQCLLSELVATFLESPAPAAREGHPKDPLRGALPLTNLVNEAIVGGIAFGLLDLAHHHIVERAHGRDTALDPDALRSAALAGLIEGKRELAATLAAEARGLTTLSDQLVDERERTNLREIPIEALAQVDVD
jgi:hypothetical protein